MGPFPGKYESVGLPFRQLIRIPFCIPAETGNPALRPFRRHQPISTFRWTPRLIQDHACKNNIGGPGAAIVLW